MAMEELIKSFLQDCQDRGMSKETVETYGWDVQDYLKFLSEKDPCKIERSDLKGYLDHLIARGVGKKTAVIYFAVLHTFYDYLLYEGLVHVNPIDPVRKRYLSSYKLDSHGHTQQIISVEDAARLVAALIDIRDKALVVLLFKTGVRRRELIAMDLSTLTGSCRPLHLSPRLKGPTG
jgi:integrase/recombinase XerD